MASPEVNSGPLYWQNRLDAIISRQTDPALIRGKYTFFERIDPESAHRSRLPNLNSQSEDIKYDDEGYVYLSIWRQTSKVDPEHRIFGPTQKGRDYSANPPKTKTLERHSWDEVKGGIDLALRRTIEVRDNYRGEGGEALAVVGVLSRLSQLRRELQNFPELTYEDMDRIIDENTQFLEGLAGFQRPRLRGKQRVMRHLSVGFIDREGRKNAGAAQIRLFAIELEARKRWEVAIPAILAKYGTMAEVLLFERDSVRQNMMLAQLRLGELLERPMFADPQFTDLDPEQRERVVRDFNWDLQRLSVQLYHHILVRPYLLGARKVFEHLGSNTNRSLTISARVQSKRREPTVWELVKEGKYTEAAQLIGFSQEVIQKVLDANDDYVTVKKGLKVKSKRTRKPKNEPRFLGFAE